MQERKPEASRKDRKWPTSSAGAFLILAAVFLLLHIPFLNQAFIIDDGNFIDQALQIVKNPLGPYSFNIHLKQVQDFFEYFANPPGFAYYLAAMIKVFGHSEVAMHSVCLIFSAMALLSMYVLSHEMTGNGLYGALLLLVTPTFLLSSHTVMPDIAAMAFYVLAILLFMRGMDRDDPRLFIAAGIDTTLYNSGKLYQAFGLDLAGHEHNAMFDVTSLVASLFAAAARLKNGG